MTDSILDSIKTALGVPLDTTVFDSQLIMHINSTLNKLNQLGVGPVDGFAIEDNTAVWATFLGSNLKYNSVKTYVGLAVRVIFDPPQVWHLMNSLNALISEMEVRISIEREEETWVPPPSPPVCSDPYQAWYEV